MSTGNFPANPAKNREILFYFVLKGDLDLNLDEKEHSPLKAGDSCVIPAGIEYSLRAAADAEVLEVALPG